MSTPKISVCLDSYNYGRFLPEAIESVLRQTRADFELIINDDCSPDDSFEIAREYARRDARVRAYRNDRNLGMVGNRNVCLARAAGEYVKPLHSDDFLASDDTLARMAAVLDAQPGVSLVAGASCGAREGEASGERVFFPDRRVIPGAEVITRCLLERRNLIGPPSAVMFRRSQAGRRFDETFKHAADLEMWLHLLEQGALVYLTEPVCAYRKHEGQITRSQRATLEPARDWLGMTERYLRNPDVRLGAAVKRRLRHNAVARLARSAREVGAPEAGAAAIRAYGAARYYLEYPFAALARHLARIGRSAARRSRRPG